jgi:hypothetical protein
MSRFMRLLVSLRLVSMTAVSAMASAAAGAARTKINGVAAADGSCGNSGVGTQTGWNIKSVRTASGAGGGSELSDAGSWSTSELLVKDLKTTTARAMYDHDATRGVMFYMYAGNYSVTFRDNGEAYSHSGNGNWQGIVGVVRGAMASSAL